MQFLSSEEGHQRNIPTMQTKIILERKKNFEYTTPMRSNVKLCPAIVVILDFRQANKGIHHFIVSVYLGVFGKKYIFFLTPPYHL
jgi:hypothetical protein